MALQFGRPSLVQPLDDPGRDLGFDGLRPEPGAAAMASMGW